MQTRRRFLQSAIAVSAGFAGLRLHLRAHAQDAAPTPAMALRRDPYGVLDLPPGFTYRVISRSGATMDDGLIVPTRHDGMAAFAGPNGRTILVRNHEVESVMPREGAFGWAQELLDRLPRESIYDFRGGQPALGGTTTLVYDTANQRLERHYLSLAGTHRNCAGGPTPWGSWITCEETTQRATDGFEHDHGFNFEVPASAEIRPAKAVPLKAMGRFRHEAIAVDPASGIVYQTEDIDDGLIYRFIPNKPGELQAGGRLQALSLRSAPSLDTRNWPGEDGTIARPVSVGPVGEASWIDLDEVEAPENDLRKRGFAAGAAKFARGEGMWYGQGAVFFACTTGGRNKTGQIWRYIPSEAEGTPGEEASPGKLELFLEPNDSALLECADNLTVAPWGDVVICEDGPGNDRIVGITPDGQPYVIARNATGDGELAGATFSPDGSTLFVNLHVPVGATLAVAGPWESLRPAATGAAS